VNAQRAEEIAFLTELPGASVDNFKKELKFTIKEEKEALARVHSILSAWDTAGSVLMFNFDQMESVSAVQGSLAKLLDTVLADSSSDGTSICWRNWFLDPKSKSLAFREVTGQDVVPRQMAHILLKVLTAAESSWAPTAVRAKVIKTEGEELMNGLGKDAKRRCVALLDAAI
jgi:hypothetical protein